MSRPWPVGALLLALGCEGRSPVSPVPPMAAPEVTAAPTLYRRYAAVGVERCAVAGGCGEETWRPEAGEGPELRLVLRGGQLVELGSGERWRRSWDALSGLLRACLGDPLAHPPAGDPRGLRLLERDARGFTWRIELSGENRCGLAGTLRLAAQRDEADARGLDVEGRLWLEGGIEGARARLAAEP